MPPLVNHNPLSDNDDKPQIDNNDYSETMFLEEVYMTPEKYATLVGLLRRKKNIILQGAPGVGKTFAAKRLAFSIMGKKDTERVKVIQFHQSYSYEDFIMGYRPNGENFSLSEGPFYSFCKLAKGDSEHPYFFIIDEINRGNISKIFGELITLVEPIKRWGNSEGMKAVLPYSQKSFGVPKNVYIIGTMNTADRSISIIDTALRRRFFFKEMLPKPDVLADVSVKDLSVSGLLARMNERIAVLYDREHTIGHAYFMPLKKNPTIKKLAEIFTNNIIPLLQEYFYEDYEQIRRILGDKFVIETKSKDLFSREDVVDDKCSYDINYAAFDDIESYRSI